MFVTRCLCVTILLSAIMEIDISSFFQSAQQEIFGVPSLCCILYNWCEQGSTKKCMVVDYNSFLS